MFFEENSQDFTWIFNLEIRTMKNVRKLINLLSTAMQHFLLQTAGFFNPVFKVPFSILPVPQNEAGDEQYKDDHSGNGEDTRFASYTGK